MFHPALRYSWQALLRIYIASPDLNENGHESQLGNLVLLGPNFKNGQYTTDIQTGLTIFLYEIGNILLDGTHSMNVLPKKITMASSTLIRVFTSIYQLGMNLSTYVLHSSKMGVIQIFYNIFWGNFLPPLSPPCNTV